MSATSSTLPAFRTLQLSLAGGIARIVLNRPEKANAINLAMWQELRRAMQWLQHTAEARVGILSAAGAHFSAGLDLASFDELQQATRDDCDGRAREKLLAAILDIQDTVTAIERCHKPVIAEVHAACVGGGIDIITACDLRYCSAQAWFCVKEIDVGLVADVGTLQRLPLLIGEGMARELCYSGRRVEGAEAQTIRLVNRCYDDAAALRQGVEEMARCLAAKSPLALRGTKQAITHAREHSIADGLQQVALWNAAMLFSNDLREVQQARSAGRAPRFAD
ncbi:crotonase/enoyl-CoA hydratase family protein [Xenophilus sp. Marseille-Q4582]|uniref:crotonase/enoyl-CoA hydratase family protein n=1 Tax=Xenophilus sp. Marseille-Q4582 TaxID=2866600 RepID=UPI001CE4540A|nr:crotonase/enoyl-CoA hydratase family protein [Xenophilus sp. Marseille-Q4582]